jgi:hypothetical protein
MQKSGSGRTSQSVRKTCRFFDAKEVVFVSLKFRGIPGGSLTKGVVATTRNVN